MADHKSGLYIYFLAIYMNDDVEVWNKIKRLYNSPHSCLLPVNWVDTSTEVRKPRSRLWRITKKPQQEISLTCLRLFCPWRIEELIKIHWFIIFFLYGCMTACDVRLRSVVVACRNVSTFGTPRCCSWTKNRGIPMIHYMSAKKSFLQLSY